MILVYPLIEISQNCCVEVVHGVPGSEHIYSVDPVQLAIMWRGENAKTLHVVDLDGITEGRIINKAIIKKIVEAVDIPIQVGGGLRSYDEVKNVLELGVYRVTMGTAAVEQPGLIEELVKEFGSRKIALALVVEQGRVAIKGGAQQTQISPFELAMQMAKIGVTRLLLVEHEKGEPSKKINLDLAKELAIKSGLRITIQGNISSYKDLMRIQELEKYGVDSAIVGRPLYENHFPCQALWRLNELILEDLGPTRRL